MFFCNYSATLLLKQRFNQIQPKFYRIAILLSNFQEQKALIWLNRQLGVANLVESLFKKKIR